ncbi:hypothetical protein ACFVAD_07595 [Sutcliffiella sp. NPDC057660]|uniref:hypothetical protein n=1 Tax=Sutcliffiella sp. NPDC057660 TaxID=3346199 RepID=UPI0036BE5CA4
MNIFKGAPIVFAGVLLLLLSFVFLVFYDFPKKIDLDYPAYEYNSNQPEYGEETRIKLQGVLKRPIFSDEVFSGKIIIDKYQETAEYELIDVGFHSENGMGSLSYTNTSNGELELNLFGVIWKSDDFDMVNIMLNNPNSQSSEEIHLRISAPANNYNEAERIEGNLID